MLVIDSNEFHFIHLGRVALQQSCFSRGPPNECMNKEKFQERILSKRKLTGIPKENFRLHFMTVQAEYEQIVPGGGTRSLNIPGGAIGMAPSPGVKLPKMIPCPAVKFQCTTLSLNFLKENCGLPGNLSEIY